MLNKSHVRNAVKLVAAVSALTFSPMKEAFGDVSNTGAVPQIVANEISNRKTINPFLAWNQEKGTDRYGLHWTYLPRKSPNTISVREIYWNYVYDWSKYPGQDEFITEKNWGHAAEYGHTLATEINNPDFIGFIADIAAQSIKNRDHAGVFLDWWHDDHPSGYTKKQVAAARRNLVEAIRSRVGDNFIIVANVNWMKETATVNEINGVFLELHKDESGRVYNTSELLKIEALLEYYDRKLAEPRMVALEGWRKTTTDSVEERNSPENRRMAKLLTAMSAVVPENGYILYGDNNQDSTKGDHDHVYYDFFSFDVGQPVSDYIKVRSGVGYREFDSGFVAYNTTKKLQRFTRENGIEVDVEPKSGLFCEDSNKEVICLSAD